MVQKCKGCGASIARWPVKGQPDKSFSENVKEGTINWLNLFKIDLNSILLLLTIFLIIFGMNDEIAFNREVTGDPCGFCEEKADYCAKAIRPMEVGSNSDVPIFNLSLT